MSYARMDFDSYVKKFFQELLASVGRIVPAATGTPGFIDQYNLQVGEEWTSALADALDGSSAMIALYTANYFTRAHCGREWRAFQLRADVFRQAFLKQERPSLILPVLWIGRDHLRTLPPVAEELNFDHHSFGAEYVKVGMSGLIRKGARYYRPVIDKLAARIAEVAARHPIVPADLANINDLDDVFAADPAGGDGDAVGPKHTKYVYVVARQSEFKAAQLPRRPEFYGGTRMDWRPYQPESHQEFALLAQSVTSNASFFYEVVPYDAATLVKRLRYAQQRHNVVVLVVDPWTLRLQEYYQSVYACDTGLDPDFLVIIPWNAKDPDMQREEIPLKGVLGGALGKRIRAGEEQLVLNSVGSANELVTRLAASLEYARDRIVNRAPIIATTPEVEFASLPIHSAVAHRGSAE
jgi:FxsC-like protein